MAVLHPQVGGSVEVTLGHLRPVLTVQPSALHWPSVQVLVAPESAFSPSPSTLCTSTLSPPPRPRSLGRAQPRPRLPCAHCSCPAVSSALQPPLIVGPAPSRALYHDAPFTRPVTVSASPAGPARPLLGGVRPGNVGVGAARQEGAGGALAQTSSEDGDGLVVPFATTRSRAVLVTWSMVHAAPRSC